MPIKIYQNNAEVCQILLRTKYFEEFNFFFKEQAINLLNKYTKNTFHKVTLIYNKLSNRKYLL